MALKLISTTHTQRGRINSKSSSQGNLLYASSLLQDVKVTLLSGLEVMTNTIIHPRQLHYHFRSLTDHILINRFFVSNFFSNYSNLRNNSCWPGYRERELLCNVGGNGNWCSHCEKQHGGPSQKLKIELPCDQVIPLPSIYPKEPKH